MRTVLVARDGQPFWDEIRRRLARVNAHVVVCAEGDLQGIAEETGPDLIILGEAAYRVQGAILQRPQIVVKEESAPSIRFDEHVRPVVAHAGWPIPEEIFLELTARMLRVAERRSFRALIRVHRPRVRQTFMGQSLDFSLTGMALNADVELEQAEPIEISFHVPREKGSIRLFAEVTRSATDPSDGSTYYGARFVDLDSTTRQKLRDFVWGGG